MKEPSGTEAKWSVVPDKPPESDNNRRAIYDLLDAGLPVARHVNPIVVKPMNPGEHLILGNHYHTPYEQGGCGHERFRILAGSVALLVLEHVKTREREIFRDLGVGTQIDIPPYVAHAFDPAPGLIMVGALEGTFNPADMNAYQLILKDEGELLPFENVDH